MVTGFSYAGLVTLCQHNELTEAKHFWFTERVWYKLDTRYNNHESQVVKLGGHITCIYIIQCTHLNSTLSMYKTTI